MSWQAGYLLVPGLAEITRLLPEMLDGLPGLRAFFRHALRSSPGHASCAELLLKNSALASSADQDIALASLLAHNLTSDAQRLQSSWALARPVLLVPDRDRLLLQPAVTQTLSDKRIRQLADEVLEAFPDLLAAIEIDACGHWLLELQQPAAISTHDFSALVNQHLGTAMPVGDDAPQWIRFMNEVQMMFHQQETVELGFNALWLEGFGSLGELADSGAGQITTILTDNPLGSAADKAGIAHSIATLPSASEMQANKHKGNLLICHERLYKALLKRDLPGCEKALEELDELLQQCLSLLYARQLKRLELIVPGRTGWFFRHWQRFFIWQRQRVSQCLDQAV